jgi:phosphohistidine phosphatase
MLLILMRHAKAVRPEDARSDEARGLTPQGRRDAALTAAHMREAGLEPVHALVSPAERTRQTAAIVAETFDQLAVEFVPTLYLAEPRTILQTALAKPRSCLLMVGHNPGLHELTIDFLDQAHDRSKLARELRERFTTSCYAAFTLSGETVTAPGPALHDAFTPRD